MASPSANPLEVQSYTRARIENSTPRILQAVHLWHLASLDAPTVAAVWTLAFARVAAVHLPFWILALIACGTWTVYVGDRLLDAQRALRSGGLVFLRARHFFHWRHRLLFIPTASAGAIIAAALIALRMPGAMRHRDSVLAAAALLYFSGVHSSAAPPHWLGKRVSKEFLVGLLFTAGCAAPTLSRLPFINWPLIVCLGLFTVLAWLNCAAIEGWESIHRTAYAFPHASALSLTCFAVAAALSFTDPGASALACTSGISALLLAWLDRERPRISAITLRTLADAVLLTPLILLTVPVIHK